MVTTSGNSLSLAEIKPFREPIRKPAAMQMGQTSHQGKLVSSMMMAAMHPHTAI